MKIHETFKKKFKLSVRKLFISEYLIIHHRTSPLLVEKGIKKWIFVEADSRYEMAKKIKNLVTKYY